MLLVRQSRTRRCSILYRKESVAAERDALSLFENGPPGLQIF